MGTKGGDKVADLDSIGSVLLVPVPEIQNGEIGEKNPELNGLFLHLTVCCRFLICCVVGGGTGW